MAIQHATPGQPIDIQALGATLSETVSYALFKSGELEVIRLILPVGKSMPMHVVPGEITIQCVEGKMEVTINGKAHVLPAGHLMYLPGGVSHSVLGLEDASGLLTIVLQNQIGDKSHK